MQYFCQDDCCSVAKYKDWLTWVNMNFRAEELFFIKGYSKFIRRSPTPTFQGAFDRIVGLFYNLLAFSSDNFTESYFLADLPSSLRTKSSKESFMEP
jgi:hypothetical protein